MANLLIVAEKPSVAKNIANALGVKENGKHEGYIEGFADYFGFTVWVAWCLGHLVQMSFPEEYDPKYAKWRLEDLPLLPEEFKYEVIPETKKQFQIVTKLMNSVGESEQDKKEKSTLSRDNKFLVPVESLVCATDAGREGELIFRLVYNQCRCKKPFERLWISSMEDAAIREGFAHLKPGTAYDFLFEAALCRERADWIVGMNATRLFSLSEPLKNPNLFIWSTVVRSVSPEKGSDLLLLSGNQRLKTAVIVFPFGAYFGVVFVF